MNSTKYGNFLIAGALAAVIAGAWLPAPASLDLRHASEESRISGGAPPVTITDIVSREFTLRNAAVAAIAFEDVISREFTLRNEPDAPAVFEDVLSREFTLRNSSAAPIEFADVISREFALRNTPAVPSGITDVVSREFTLSNVFLDCNENGIADQCDVGCGPPGSYCDVAGCGLSADCDGNIVPDECDPDCDGDGNPDACEITDCAGDLDCTDCNGNGVPDGCDIDPTDPDGDGEVSGDCDANDVPDECDIIDCPPGNDDCADCNLNDTPDVCDVDPTDPDGDGNVSPDINGDGVPDECVEWDGEAPDDLWSTSLNWEQNFVPGVSDPLILESVIIDAPGASVILDVNAGIDGLILGEGSLAVTDGDITVLDPTGTLGGNAFVGGSLTIGDGRSIEVAGTTIIGPEASYGSAGGAVSATFSVGTIIVLGGTTIDEAGGTLDLSSSMELSSSGMFLNGCNSDDKDGGKGTGTPPPSLKVSDDAVADIDGTFAICRGGDVTHNSSQHMQLSGDFENHSTAPLIFDWLDGGLTMNGGTQTIEAAGEDRGPWPAGLVDNFAIGTLIVASGATVEVVDTFDNQLDGEVGCDEALYVRMLNVEAGATLITNGCTVYYEQLCDGKSCDGSIPALGVHVFPILEPIDFDFNGNGEIDAFDLAALLGSWGDCVDCEDCPADIDGDCDVDAFDLANLLGIWGPVQI
jgi:hypothetical protein